MHWLYNINKKKNIYKIKKHKQKKWQKVKYFCKKKQKNKNNNTF